MNGHDLATARSRAYHQAIAERLARDQQILEVARGRVAEWTAAMKVVPFYARQWAEILARDPTEVAAFLCETSELADELRQSSPFAGALDPRERWRIWREVGERMAGVS
jgi:hypothetical protein